MIYTVVQCSKCTWIGTIQSQVSLKCRGCNRTTKLDLLKKAGCVYGTYKNPHEASERCQALKYAVKGKFRLKIKKGIREGKNLREI